MPIEALAKRTGGRRPALHIGMASSGLPICVGSKSSVTRPASTA